MTSLSTSDVTAKIFAAVQFDNSYAGLPAGFFVPQLPVPVEAPQLIRINTALAAELGLDVAVLETAEGRAAAGEIFSGNVIPHGAHPLAQAYSGHQFGNFSPQLGDGRAVLLGEVLDVNGRRWDMQLKGSGPTPFSRGGDGRSALGPVIREYIVSEAMYALGVPTTRSLAAVSTGEPVYRQGMSPGGVLTRLASSHVRVGTFQFFASRGDLGSVKTLADYVIDRHYPTLAQADNPYLALLEAVMDSQSVLVAHWMQLGFIHGVMNTDNMSISGETIDYGPCAFMDRYDIATVFSSIDRGGRYAYGNQGRIAQWNMARLAEALLPLFDEDMDRAVEKAEALITDFQARFREDWLAGMGRKLGLLKVRPEDLTLVNELLGFMQEAGADFTQTFRALGAAVMDEEGALYDQIGQTADVIDWCERWQDRLNEEGADHEAQRARLDGINPVYIPRNHLVEAAIAAGEQHQDYSVMEKLIEVLSRPFEARAGLEDYALPPEVEDPNYKTFCGT